MVSYFAAILAASTVLSGCQGNDEANRKAELEKFRRFCNTFDYVAPEWKSAASGLRKRIQSGEVDPSRDILLRSGNGTSASQRVGASLQDDVGKTTIDIYRVFVGGDFIFDIKMPVYHHPNPPFSLSAPPSSDFDCAGLEGKSVYDYF